MSKAETKAQVIPSYVDKTLRGQLEAEAYPIFAQATDDLVHVAILSASPELQEMAAMDIVLSEKTREKVIVAYTRVWEELQTLGHRIRDDLEPTMIPSEIRRKRKAQEIVEKKEAKVRRIAEEEFHKLRAQLVQNMRRRLPECPTLPLDVTPVVKAHESLLNTVWLDDQKDEICDTPDQLAKMGVIATRVPGTTFIKYQKVNTMQATSSSSSSSSSGVTPE